MCCIRLLYGYVSVTTQPIFAISLHLIYSYFDIIGPYGVDFRLLLDIQFLCEGFPFSATSNFYRVRCRLFAAWNVRTVVFLLFLFSRYFRSVDPRVVSIVSGGRDPSSTALFYVVFESLYRCINAIFTVSNIFTAYIRFSNSFSFLTNSLMSSSMYIRWLIFSCDWLSLYPFIIIIIIIIIIINISYACALHMFRTFASSSDDLTCKLV